MTKPPSTGLSAFELELDSVITLNKDKKLRENFPGVNAKEKTEKKRNSTHE